MTESVSPTRVILVGEQNPYGGDDAYALYPAPAGCSGHRLCCLILGMSRRAYLKSFERLNLVQGPWSAAMARHHADELTKTSARFILCGAKVCKAFQIPFMPFEISEGGRMLILPHPSGLNRLWNSETILEARGAVAAFAPHLAPLLGKGGNDEEVRRGESCK
jgi:hypothetical protein